MVKFLSLIISLLIFITVSEADSITPDNLIIKGKKLVRDGLNGWDEKDLLKARALFERALSQDEDNYLYHYYVGYADYRLAIFYKEEDKMIKYLDDGIKYLEKSIKLNDKFSDSHALLGSLYGTKISIKWWLAITLGPKSRNELKKAIELDPKNPRAYLVDGISKYHTPTMWGGGIDKAIKSLLKAVSLYESATPPDSLMPGWGHDEAYIWLGLCYMKEKDYKKAKIQFVKALEINPQNGWVKYQLLKKVEEKLEVEQQQ